MGIMSMSWHRGWRLSARPIAVRPGQSWIGAEASIGVQFHPEVKHTPHGSKILANFLFNICKLQPLWTMQSFVEATTRALQEKVGDDSLFAPYTGGVELLRSPPYYCISAIGDNLTCIFVNNGVLRQGEAEKVVQLFREHYRLNLVYVDASASFLKLLAGIIDRRKNGGVWAGNYPGVRRGSQKIGAGKISGPGNPLPRRH